MAQTAKRKSANPAHRSSGRPRSASADRAILDAALSLFIQNGFDNISMDGIAERAGVAKTTLYRRWASKADVVAEAIATARGSPEQALARQPGPISESIDSIAEMLAAPDFRRMAARLIGAAADHPELLTVYWKTHIAPRREAMVGLLEDARRKGLIRAGANVETVLDMIGGALTYRLLVRPGNPSKHEIKSLLRDVLHEVGVDYGQLERPRNRTGKSRISEPERSR